MDEKALDQATHREPDRYRPKVARPKAPLIQN